MISTARPASSRTGIESLPPDRSAATHRRVARGVVPTAELLVPIDEHVLASDRWPHFVWVTPGEALPV
jgi:hypothetical protein